MPRCLASGPPVTRRYRDRRYRRVFLRHATGETRRNVDEARAIAEIIDMREQVLDAEVRFSCRGCTWCCDQPWRTMIERDKADDLLGHDWSKYPQLQDRKLCYPDAGETPDLFPLAKGSGTRCLFLDADGRCIIHKELGPEAKPNMCRQFPFLPARTPSADRVSVNFGCSAVQDRHGATLAEQAEEIADVVARTPSAPVMDQPVALDGTCTLTAAEADALFARACGIFDPGRASDMWSRFAELLAMLVAVRRQRTVDVLGLPEEQLVAALRGDGPLPDVPNVNSATPFESMQAAPMPVRLLFAATMYPDAVPRDAMGRLSFTRRMRLLPKLFSIANLRGGYASRLLGRNVSIDDVLHSAGNGGPDAAATTLLCRYFRSRLWQRFLAGTRLPIMAGVHQHILDFNAILFFARAEACAAGRECLEQVFVRRGLTLVEFHLANQRRLSDQVLRRWFRGILNNVTVAFESLRMLAPARQPEPVR